MNFLKKHHAVRGGPSGPDWRKATDEALRGWANGPGPLATEAAAELERRAKLAAKPKPAPTPGSYDPATDHGTQAWERHVREGGD